MRLSPLAAHRRDQEQYILCAWMWLDVVPGPSPVPSIILRTSNLLHYLMPIARSTPAWRARSLISPSIQDGPIFPRVHVLLSLTVRYMYSMSTQWMVMLLPSLVFVRIDRVPRGTPHHPNIGQAQPILNKVCAIILWFYTSTEHLKRMYTSPHPLIE